MDDCLRATFDRAKAAADRGSAGESGDTTCPFDSDNGAVDGPVPTATTPASGADCNRRGLGLVDLKLELEDAFACVAE